MELNAPSFLPFQRQDAYQPSDPKSYLKLQQLHCVRSDDAAASLKDPLCSHCKEMILGEPLLDKNDNDTRYRIALYALPCGHLRCCSCALKWLDTAGLFNRICQPCDSQKLNLNPDLSTVLDTLKASFEPDLSWIQGFPRKKPSKSPTPTKYSPIRLPTVEEINAEDDTDIAQDVDLGTLALQTPAKRRKIDRQAPFISNTRISASETPDQFQWTPVAQRKEDIIDAFNNKMIPEEDSDDDKDVAEMPAESASPKPRSAIRKKKDRLHGWACRAKRTSSDFCSDETETEEHGPSFQEFLEEEKRIRKEARYAF